MDKANKTTLKMTAGERDRAFLVRQVVEKRLGQSEASERLGIGLRQMGRLVLAWRQDGDSGLISQQRGKPSHNRLNPDIEADVEAALQSQYPDFGPTFAAEKLEQLQGLKVSKETVRHIQMKLKLWKPKVRKQKKVHQPRDRRPRFGELVQIDGSPHDWFEGRSAYCTLIVFIDDATSRLLALLFVPSETTEAYLTALKGYVLLHGIPLAFYSDRHGVFRVNAKDAVSGDGKTEFNRVTERLKIEQICAHTPQAKGRVERANQTLQDRLIKEMRLQNISSPEQAKAFFPKFIADWNIMFGVPPLETTDAHRPWTGTPAELDSVLARREERTLSKALTFRAEGCFYALNVIGPGTALRSAKITLHYFMNGTMEVHYKDRILPYRTLKTKLIPTRIENEKTINERMGRVIRSAA